MKINYLAVIVAAVVHWILGGVWYGVFSGPFANFVGNEKLKDLETRSEAKAFILAFLCSLAIVYLLARFLHSSKSVALGMKVVFLLWLGFVAATQLLTVLFEGRSPGLYLLNIGYQLLASACAGAILLVWKPRVRQTMEGDL